MRSGWLGWIIAAPFLLLLVLFVLSNTDTVTIRLWPTDLALPVPLALALLTALGIGVLGGAAMQWVGKLVARREAAKAERKLAALEAQLRDAAAKPIMGTISAPI